MGLYENLTACADVLKARTGGPSDVVVVLGSGLGGYPKRHPEAIAVPYGDLPGFPQPKAVGHEGTAYSWQAGENRVLAFSGRVHAYEGHPMDVVTFAVRTAILAGCRKVLLTNAAGGCGDDLVPGDLVLITDHLNFCGISPLAGENDDRLGPRFPDMTDTYTPELRAKAHAAGSRVGVGLKEGAYFWWIGPMFETPTEVRTAKALGCALVGMSTVPEAIAARHMGAEILGISLCTNLAAGMSGQRLSSEEVIECAAEASERFSGLLDELLPTL